MSNNSINNLQVALAHYIAQYCEKGEVVRAINGSKGSPIAYVFDCKGGNDNDDDGSKRKRSYIMFKRDWFYSFSDIYTVPDKGIGQTFNMNIVSMAAPEGAYLTVVMPEKKIYEVLASSVYDYIMEYGTSRTPSTEVTEEGSIPAKMLKRVEPIERLN